MNRDTKPEPTYPEPIGETNHPLDLERKESKITLEINQYEHVNSRCCIRQTFGVHFFARQSTHYMDGLARNKPTHTDSHSKSETTQYLQTII